MSRPPSWIRRTPSCRYLLTSLYFALAGVLPVLTVDKSGRARLFVAMVFAGGTTTPTDGCHQGHSIRQGNSLNGWRQDDADPDWAGRPSMMTIVTRGQKPATRQRAVSLAQLMQVGSADVSATGVLQAKSQPRRSSTHQNTGAASGVLHPGHQAVRANGCFYAGTFTPTPQAKTLSRVSIFQDDLVSGHSSRFFRLGKAATSTTHPTWSRWRRSPTRHAYEPDRCPFAAGRAQRAAQVRRRHLGLHRRPHHGQNRAHARWEAVAALRRGKTIMDHKAQRRIARFIEPFRVDPGSKVNLAKDFDPAFEAGIKKKKDGVDAAEGRHRASRGVPGAARRSGHVRRPGCASSARCRGQGRDDPPRDERPQPAGRAGRELQGPVGARARPGLLAPLPETVAVARGDRHLQPVALRGGAGRPGAPGEPPPSEASGRDARSIMSGNAGTKRSTTGSGTCPRTGSGSSSSS